MIFKNLYVSVRFTTSVICWLATLSLCMSLPLNAQTKSVKRGVSFDSRYINEADIPALAPGMFWFYDWGNSPSAVATTTSDKYGIEYCPMAWNAAWDEQKISDYIASHPDCKYILAYNEPNFTSQAYMTPAQAAADWPRLRALADKLGVKLISPACNYSPWSDWDTPKKWLDAFFQLVPIEQVDGIALHCYMGWSTSLIDYVKEYIEYYKKPIWLTEFCAWDDRSGTPEASMKKIQKEYLIDTFDFLETEPMVARYAWFISKTGENSSKPAFPWMQLLDGNDGTLTELGLIFNHMSSYDPEYYHSVNVPIEAEHYIRMNGIYMEKTVDEDGFLDIYDYQAEDYLEYQIDIPEDGTYYIFFRYTSGEAPALKVASDTSGTFHANLTYSGGQETWATRKISIPLKKGKQTVRISLLSGTLRMNWLAVSPNPDFLKETDPAEDTGGENLALGKQAFASSEQNHWKEGKLLATRATDGNSATRWATEWEGANPDTENWFIIDLESNDVVAKKIVIRWEDAFATAYEISQSHDNKTWEPVYSTTEGKGGTETISVHITQRYVKWKGITKATQYGYSFYEFEVWGAIKTGIKEAKREEQLSVFPNPVKNTLFLSTPCDIVLLNLKGDILFEANKIPSMDMSPFAAGIYILKANMKEGRNRMKKIIKIE